MKLIKKMKTYFRVPKDFEKGKNPAILNFKEYLVIMVNIIP